MVTIIIKSGAIGVDGRETAYVDGKVRRWCGSSSGGTRRLICPRARYYMLLNPQLVSA